MFAGIIFPFTRKNRLLYAWVSAAGAVGPWTSLDFHTWYRYSR